MAALYLKTRRHQMIMVGIACVGLGVLVIALVWALSQSDPDVKQDVLTKETHIETTGTRLDPQAVWVERLENEAQETQKKIEHLEKIITESVQHIQGKDEEIQSLKDELRSLLEMQKAIAEHNNAVVQTNHASTHPSHHDRGPRDGSMESKSPEHFYQPQQMIKKITLNFKSSSSNAKKTVENTIPAGAFAKAILLGGIDASTSIQAASDPRPLLLRVIDPGTLPRRFKSDLKNCHVLASSYGDLSSERVYMRLEKLTCTEPLTGEIIETDVAGYISGEDGRTGVRGTIVDRAGEVIRNSLLGGFLSGMSQFLGAQQQRSMYPISPLGQANALSPQAMLGAGAANGAGNAMEKYSEFFIKRAEQLQPVIQIAAGRTVDIVFTQGTPFGDSRVKKVLGRVREASRRETLSNLEQQTDSQHWLPPVDGETPVDPIDTHPYQ